MGVLTKEAILKLIKEGKLKIEPLDEDQIGVASIDLTLSNAFRIFYKRTGILDSSKNDAYKSITKVIKVKDYLVLSPGELVEGITKETITLPTNLAGRIEGRSRFARAGIVVHLTSAFVHPGMHGKIVLEIVNLAPVPVILRPGLRICQLILETTEGEAKYRGKFYNQKLP
jgi:dCTP deaminase